MRLSSSLAVVLALCYSYCTIRPAHAQTQQQTCNSEVNTDYNGTVLKNETATSLGDCCSRCQQYDGCSVYVYCPSPSGCDNGYGTITPAKTCNLKAKVLNRDGSISVWSRGSATPFSSGLTTAAGGSSNQGGSSAPTIATVPSVGVNLTTAPATRPSPSPATSTPSPAVSPTSSRTPPPTPSSAPAPRLAVSQQSLSSSTSPGYAGIPEGVTLVPNSPGIGSTALLVPNTTAGRVYLCPKGSSLAFLTISNATLRSATFPTAALNTITDLQGNCSDGSTLPSFWNNDSYSRICQPLGFPSTYTVKDSVLSPVSLSGSITYGTSGPVMDSLWGFGGTTEGWLQTNCPNDSYIVGYAGMETCSGINLVQFACGNMQDSRAGAKAIIEDSGSIRLTNGSGAATQQDSNPLGIPAGVTLIPGNPGIGSTSSLPNITANRAFLCPKGSYLSSLDIANATLQSYRYPSAGPNTVTGLLGNCSDGSMLPDLWHDPAYNSLCTLLSFPPEYTKTWNRIQTQSLNSSSITYGSNGVAVNSLWGYGGQSAEVNSISCPSGSYIVGYAGLNVCNGLNMLQFACGTSQDGRAGVVAIAPNVPLKGVGSGAPGPAPSAPASLSAPAPTPTQAGGVEGKSFSQTSPGPITSASAPPPAFTALAPAPRMSSGPSTVDAPSPEIRAFIRNATAPAPGPIQISDGSASSQSLYGQTCQPEKSVGQQIFGGSESSIDRYPYMVSLRSKEGYGATAARPTHFCGGTLIHEKVILTAAHCCASNANGGMWVPDYNTSVRQPIANPPVAVRGAQCASDEGTESSNILYALLHPAWNRDVFAGYDICIMILETKFNTTAAAKSSGSNRAGTILPKLASLTDYRKKDLPFKFLAAGWGTTQQGSGPSPTLKDVPLTILDSRSGNAIASALNPQGQGLLMNQFLATSASGATCSGDSGGPIVYSPSNHTDSSTDIVVGIVSYGPKECRPGSWSVFSDITSFNFQNRNCSVSSEYSPSRPGEILDNFVPCTMSLLNLDDASLKSNETDFTMKL